MDNLELWNKVCVTDIGDTKGFKSKGGFKGTAICAQSQRKKATEVFGVYGIGWGVENEQYDLIVLDHKDSHSNKVVYTATLYFTWKEVKGSFPIASEIDAFSYIKNYDSWMMGNDLYKKVRTDAMTKGLSELGFNADVFEGKFDDNKYVQNLRNEHHKQEQKEPPFQRNKAIAYIDELMHKFNFSNEQAIAIQKKYTAAKTRADFVVIQKEVEGE